MSESAFITRGEAEALRDDWLVPASKWKPAIWGFSRDGVRYMVKDVSDCHWLFRNSVGALSLYREECIYRRLSGLEFVPGCEGRMGRYALILERVEGRSLRGRKDGTITAEFFDAMERCIDRLHQHGVVHLDLGHRSNVMVSPSGAPILIDFEVALYLGTNRLSRMLLHPLLRWADYAALTKYRLRYVPEVVGSIEARRFDRMRVWRRLWPTWRIWPLPGFRHKKGSGRSRSSDQR